MSQQKEINRNGFIDRELLNKYSEEWTKGGFVHYSENWRHLITTGCFIKYITEIEGCKLFRSGGMVLVIENDYMIISSYSIRFSLQFDNIKEIWIKPRYKKLKEKKEKKESIKVVYFKQPDPSKLHKLYIGNKLIFSSNVKNNIIQSEKTKKYLYALETGNFIVQ